jgi:hypothetical protein
MTFYPLGVKMRTPKISGNGRVYVTSFDRTVHKLIAGKYDVNKKKSRLYSQLNKYAL